MGVPVTRRIGAVRQPRGGYVPLKSFTVDHFEDGRILHDKESLKPGVVGTVVDNLVRLLSRPVTWPDGLPTGQVPAEKAFDIALLGAERFSPDALEMARGYVSHANGLDDTSIRNACRLMAYDAYFRAGSIAYRNPETFVPDQATIENIKTMVMRCTEFFEMHGPVTCLGPTFDGAYTTTVSEGDGDLLTRDCIWDIKTSAKKPNTRDTLQVYVYYLMGKRSIVPEFSTIGKMGIFNPRLNEAYVIAADSIGSDVKDAVEHEVIGY